MRAITWVSAWSAVLVSMCLSCPARAGGANEEVEGLHTLVVRFEPSSIPAAGGHRFELAQLIKALKLRLSSAGVRVVPQEERTPGGQKATWLLEVVSEGWSVTMRLSEPQGRCVALRHIPARRYRPHDLVQTISLSTWEGLLSVLQGPDHLPPPEAWPAPVTTSAQAPAPRKPAEQAGPTQAVVREKAATEVLLGVQLRGGITVPASHMTAGIGLSASVARRMLLAHLSVSFWTPIEASGGGYQITVRPFTAYLGGGLRRAFGRWHLGADAGPALRLIYDDRRGEQVVPDRRWHWAAGLGGRLHATLIPHDGLGIRLGATACRFFTYPKFTLHAKPILDAGSSMLGVSVSLVMAL